MQSLMTRIDIVFRLCVPQNHRMTASSSTDAALPIYTSQVEMPLYLSPSYLAHPMEGVREQLNRSVLRYVEQFGGVLLSYSDLRLQRPLGRIAFDAPEIHIRVAFEATYFAPSAGDVLGGTVSRVGGDHIAILVLGVFNASVALPSDWDAESPSVQPDHVVHLQVRTVHHANGLLSMHGELAPSGGAASHPRTNGAARAAPGTEEGTDTSGKRRRSKENKDKSEKSRKKKRAA